MKGSFLLGLILSAALLLRIIKLDQSLWLDEAISVQTTEKYNFLEIITKFAPGDVHPPGYYLLLELWVNFFGDSEISIRTPSIIFSLLTIIFTYKLASKLFNKKVGLLSALFLAINPLFVYYSQESRMYSMATFFVVLSFYFLHGVLKEQKYSAVFYVMSNFFVLITDYMAYFIFPVQIIFLLFIKRRKLWRIFSLIVISIVLNLPFLMILPNQLSLGFEVANKIPTWSKTVGGASLKDLFLVGAKTIIGRISIENKILYFTMVFISLIIYLYAIFQIRKNKNVEIKLLATWIIIPVLLSFLASFFVPILSYHRLIFILPSLFIIIAAGVSNLGRIKSGIIVTTILLTSLTSLLLFYISPKFQRENWKDAVKFVESYDETTTQVLFEDNHVPAPFDYYAKHTSNLTPGLKNIPAQSKSDIVNSETLMGKSELFVFEYLYQINDPDKLLIEAIEDKGFRKSNVYDFSGVGFIYEFRKY